MKVERVLGDVDAEEVQALTVRAFDGQQSLSPPSGALSETVLLGAVAYRVGKPFTWDAQHLKAGVPEAERFLRKEYRKGWSVEG